MALTDYMVNKPILRTERLTSRQLLPSDIPALKEWMPDKSLYTYGGKPALFSMWLKVQWLPELKILDWKNQISFKCQVRYVW